MRHEDWEARLYERISAWRDREFAYGTSDCCAFAGDVVEALTGENPWAPWREQYADADSAMTAIRARGYRNLYHALTKTLGKSVPVAMARRGDVVYATAKHADFPQVGICLGERSISWGEDDGLIEVPTLSLKRAWRV